MLHLRYFVAVAEELNFTAAAKRLHMAASPLSRRIKDLEHELGRPLFERSTHHVTLTPAGAALLPIARDVLDRVTSIPWRLDEATDAPTRHEIFLGIPAGLHPELRDRVRALTERAAGRYELKRWPGASPELLDAVRDGQLDLALTRMPVTDPALELLPAMSERLGAVVPADAFADRDAVGLAELTDFAYVPTPMEVVPSYFDQLDRELRDLGVRKRITLSHSGFAGVSEIVSSQRAFSISMLDERSPMHLYRLENVAVLPFSDFRADLQTNLVWRRDRASGDLAGLIGAVRTVFADPLTS